MENEKVEFTKFESILNNIYECAVEGLLQMGNVEKLAHSYYDKSKSVEDCVDSLIRSQCLKCGTISSLTSLGGALTLPFTITAAVGGALYVQLRMIAAIVCIANFAFDLQYDIRNDDKVRTLILACLVGNKLKDAIEKLLKEVISEQLGKKAAEKAAEKAVGVTVKKFMVNKTSNQMVKHLSGQVTRSVSKTYFKRTFFRAIPLLSTIIFSAIDMKATYEIGSFAKKEFILSNRNYVR